MRPHLHYRTKRSTSGIVSIYRQHKERAAFFQKFIFFAHIKYSYVSVFYTSNSTIVAEEYELICRLHKDRPNIFVRAVNTF